MRIIILIDIPFPNGMATSNRIKNYASALSGGGLDVEVLISRRTERYGIIPKNTQGKGFFNGIPFRYSGGTPLRGSNVLIRYFNDKLDLWRTDKYLYSNLKRNDVLLLYLNNNLTNELHFVKIAHSVGAFCVRELCELPYGTGIENERSIRLRKKTLSELFPKLDGVISISDSLLQLAQKFTSPNCKHIKVPILVDFDKYYLPYKSIDNTNLYIFHSGTLTQQKDGILGMLKAFGIAINKGIPFAKFLMTGNIENSFHRDEIKKIINVYHLEDKVLFLGYLSDEELKKYLSNASLVIINKLKTQQNKYCFSTKLGEYLAAAKPVIITNYGEATNWLVDGVNAYFVEPEDSEALSDAIVKVFNSLEESRRIGIEGQKVCRMNFDYKNWSQPLTNFMKNLS